MACILILKNSGKKEKRVHLSTFPILLGRDHQCSVRLEGSGISRRHATIKKRGRLYVLQDQDSKNGTYLNGDKILNAILKNGDRVIIGSQEMTFLTPREDIRLIDDIDNFNMVVAEELGIPGAMNINPQASLRRSMQQKRINAASVFSERAEDAFTQNTTFNMLADLGVSFDFQECANILFKSLHTLLPMMSRIAIFTWKNSENKLLPKLAHHFQSNKKNFILSKRSMEDVLNRKQGIILGSESANVTQSGRNRLILPMLYNNTPICLLHIEADLPAKPIEEVDAQRCQYLINAASSIFEAIILRDTLDGFVVGMLDTLVATIEAKDTYTHGHSERVAKYSMAIAEQLRLDRKTKKNLLASALCHDIGKIGIHDAILKKASVLNADEYEEMKLHPTIGADIIRHLPHSERFISGVKYHHEKWDGTGYPEGLIGEEIPFFARIVGISDAFDAMISGRTYSGFMDAPEAIERLSEETDLFDPELIQVFVKAFSSGLIHIKTNTQNRDPEENSLHVK